MKTLPWLLMMLATPAAFAAAPASRYVVTTATVRDTRASLTWQRVVPGTSPNLASAHAYCAALDLGGFSTGWRLPTIKELQTLVDVRSASPTIDPTAFPLTPNDVFWSATPMFGNPGYVWVMYFNVGSTSSNDAYNGGRVRCVR